MKPTDKQRLALLTAYADETELVEDQDPEFGMSPRTVQSLVQAGLIAPCEESDEDSYQITPAGKEALGAVWPHGRVPKTFRAAARQAMEALGVDLSEAELKRPSDMPQTWYSDAAECDFTEAKLVVVGALCDNVEVTWSAVATMLTEAGFACYATMLRNIVVFWPED